MGNSGGEAYRVFVVILKENNSLITPLSLSPADWCVTHLYPTWLTPPEFPVHMANLFASPTVSPSKSFPLLKTKVQHQAKPAASLKFKHLHRCAILTSQTEHCRALSLGGGQPDATTETCPEYLLNCHWRRSDPCSTKSPNPPAECGCSDGDRAAGRGGNAQEQMCWEMLQQLSSNLPYQCDLQLRGCGI